MNTQEWVYAGVLFGVTGIYFFTIFYFWLGWRRSKQQVEFENKSNTFVSVIVPARNEAANILACLQSIIDQNYPLSNFEIIVVNDHSTDQTEQLLEQFSGRIKVVHLNEEKGKKAAITKGVVYAQGPLVVTTDADVTVPKTWLQQMASFYDATAAKMILMPVAFKDEKGWFQQLQSVEFMSLMGSTAGAAAMNQPFLCNGANLAFERSAFNIVRGYQDNENIASGDDVFLLHKIKKQYPNGVRFYNALDVTVYTKAQRTLKEFIAQRVRWAGKARHYTDNFSVFLSWLVLLTNLILLSGIVTLILHPNVVIPVSIAFGIKWLIDLAFLGAVANHLGKTRFLIWFPVQQVAYIFYVIYIVLAMNAVRPKWKGRKL